MRVAVVTAATPFRAAPEKARAAALCTALRAAGVEAEVVALPFAPTPPIAVPPQLLAFRLLDLSESMGTRIDRLIGLGLPASAVAHPLKILWHAAPPPAAGRDWPGAAETDALLRCASRQAAAESHSLFATSRHLADSLAQDWKARVQTLYQPSPLAPLCRPVPPEDYILADGCDADARLALLLDALEQSRAAIRVVATAAHWPAELAAQAERLAPGQVTLVSSPAPERLAALLGAARAVLLAGRLGAHTDIALAAMLCGRPLLVASDAGAPLELVRHGQTGLVFEPAATPLADALATTWSDRRRVRDWGEIGLQRYGELAPSWESVTRCLLASA